jgi:hypothetical protein
MSEPEFVRIERRFLGLVSQPRSIAEAAQALSASDPEGFPLCRWIDAPNEQLAAVRLGIYSHMYFARLRDSLREDFAVFASQVSASAFDRLAAKYLLRHPSRDPSLRYHGQYFPEFLEHGLASRETEFLELRADSAALCRLEWARIEVFDAPGARLLRRDDLAQLAPASWSELSLRAVPAVRLLVLDFTVHEAWCAVEERARVPEPRARFEALLVFRRGYRVFQRVVSGAEARALALLLNGATFSEICTCFADEEVTLEACAERALSALMQWLADELLMLPEQDQVTQIG